MKDTSERLKQVKTNHELPESLEQVDFNELKEEFTVMADFSKRLKEMPQTNLPPQFLDVNFQDVEADFQSMATTSGSLANLPKRDRVKELNFSDVTTGYTTINTAKSSIKDLDASTDLKTVNVNYDNLKTEFERMYDVADKLKNIKDAKELPETLENVNL
jgi:proteasome assembly chaperone (PAC2) family protein